MGALTIATKTISRTVTTSSLYTTGWYFADVANEVYPQGIFSSTPQCLATLAYASATAVLATLTGSSSDAASTQRWRLLSASSETISARIALVAFG